MPFKTPQFYNRHGKSPKTQPKRIWSDYNKKNENHPIKSGYLLCKERQLNQMKGYGNGGRNQCEMMKRKKSSVDHLMLGYLNSRRDVSSQKTKLSLQRRKHKS